MNSGRVVLGALLIAAGIVWLLAGYGWLPVTWGLLELVFRYGRFIWPLLIVAAGVMILAGRGSRAVLLTILIVVAMVALLWPLAFLVAGPGYFIEDIQHRSIPVDQVTVAVPRDPSVIAARLVATGGIADVAITGGSREHLVSGTVTGALTRPEVSWHVAGNKAEVLLDAPVGNFLMPRSRPRMLLHTSLQLHDSIPWELQLELGASRVDIDLRDVTVSGLELNTGAAKIDAVFGDLMDGARIKVAAGAGEISLTFPRTVGVELRVAGAFGTRHLADFSRLDDDTYRSNNWEQAGKRIHVHVDAGVHSLNVNWLTGPVL